MIKISEKLLLTLCELPKSAIKLVVFIVLTHDQKQKYVILNYKTFSKLNNKTEKTMFQSDFSKGVAALQKAGFILNLGTPGLYAVNRKLFIVESKESPINHSNSDEDFFN